MMSDLTNDEVIPLSVRVVIHDKHGRILLQKRDDNPTIMEPGCWGLFGGQVENGESLEVALARELREELNSNVGIVKSEIFRASIGTFGFHNVVFLMEFSDTYEPLTLNEGQTYDWFSLDELVELRLSILVYQNLSYFLHSLSQFDAEVDARLEQALLRHCGLDKKNERVYYASGVPASLDMQSILIFKELATYRDLPMIRICLHLFDHEPIQEMLMVHTRPQTVGPLQQDKTSLSYHIIDGCADVRLHDKLGSCIWEKRLDSNDSFCSRSIRLDAKVFRSIQTFSPYTVFLEVAGGPFKDNDTNWLKIK